eukprot:TRINITY_DN74033_c0_g1_i1.p1 TRINITY_DN74033_c0_g1~~TRINITY_DN74033_c0_g1_i1.p1  ORF type:complete len:705 (-),score=124.69 TRINITY_DN74033_c0_g1_i1:194-2308(-)
MAALPYVDVKSDREATDDTFSNRHSALDRSYRDAAKVPLQNRIDALERQMSTVVGMLSDEFVFLKSGSYRADPPHMQDGTWRQLTKSAAQKSTDLTDSFRPCSGRTTTQGNEELPEAVNILRNDIAVLSGKLASLQQEHSCAMGSLGSLTAQVAKASVLAVQRLEERMLRKQDKLEHKAALHCALLAQQAKAAVEEVRSRVLEVANTVASNGGLEIASQQTASESCDRHAMNLDAGPSHEDTFRSSGSSSFCAPPSHESGRTVHEASHEKSKRCFTNWHFIEELPESLQGVSASIQEALSLLELPKNEGPEVALPRHEQPLQPQQQEALPDLADGQELVIGAQHPEKFDELKRLLQLSEVSITDMQACVSNNSHELVTSASMGLTLSRSASDSMGPSSQCLSRWQSGMLVANMDLPRPVDRLDGSGSTHTLQPAADRPLQAKGGDLETAIDVAAPRDDFHSMAQVPALALGRSQSMDPGLLPNISSPSASGASSASTVLPQHSGPVSAFTGPCSHCQGQPQQLRRMHSSGDVFLQSHQLTPRGQQLMPQGHLMPQQQAPQGHQLRSQFQLTPGAQQVSPCGRPLASLGQHMSQGQLVSPRGQQLITSGQQLPPCVSQFTPQSQKLMFQGQQVSAGVQQLKPQGQELSPRGLQVSPRGQSLHWGAATMQARAVPQTGAAVPMQAHERTMPEHRLSRARANTPPKV